MKKVSSLALKRAELLRAKQDRVIDALVENAVEPDWSAIAKNARATPKFRAFLKAIAKRVTKSKAFRERAQATILNGQCLAIWSVRKLHKKALIVPAAAKFAELDIATPADAIAYWKEQIPLTEEQAALLLRNIDALARRSAVEMTGTYLDDMTGALADLYARAAASELSVVEFRQMFAEIMPSASKASIERIYRTSNAKAFGDEHRAEVMKAPAITHLRYVTKHDDRVRPAHRAMHGFIAAKQDEIWIEWAIPAGHNCRCLHQPIGFLEAKRMGIIDYGPGGKGVVLIGGSRPFGSPPRFVTDKSGKAIPVKPDAGFGIAA